MLSGAVKILVSLTACAVVIVGGAVTNAQVTLPTDGTCGTSWPSSTQHHHRGTGTPDECKGNEHPNGANEYYFGFAGDDTFLTAASAVGYWDYAYGHEGNDIMDGQRGRDYLEGNSGFDRLGGGNGGDEIHGAYDTDHVSGGREGDVVYGGCGEDEVLGGGGPDTVSDVGCPSSDHDVACGGSSTDSVNVKEDDSSSTDVVYNPFDADIVSKDPIDAETDAYCNGEPTGFADTEDIDQWVLDILEDVVD